MLLKDVRPGTVVYTSERIGHDDGTWEVREVFYLREKDAACLYPYNVRVARLGLVQGDPMHINPRYKRVCHPPCRDPGEADGRTVVLPVGQGNAWYIIYHREMRP